MIRIILAEDHPIVRSGIKGILETEGDMEVIGQVASGEQVLELLAQGIVPDLILSDISMPGMDGLETLESIEGGPPRNSGINLVYVGQRKIHL
jgi:DNA-binding NarL/FixJ family response regulator